MLWNDLVSGVLLIVLTGAAWVGSRRLRRPGWIIGALGCWLLVAPAALRYDAGPDVMYATWNDVVVGQVLLIAGLLWPRPGPGGSG